MTEINEKRKNELKDLAIQRAYLILENWWVHTGDFQAENNLTDKELDFALENVFKINIDE